jgi:GDPmannose 4,6-dehydratase
MMLQHNEPDDYVLATNETHTVRELVEVAAKRLGINLAWRGEGVKEEGIDDNTGKVIIKIDPEYFRPAEVDLLIGDSAKAKKKIGWEPKTKFKKLVEIMVDADLEKETYKQGLSHD